LHCKEGYEKSLDNVDFSCLRNARSNHYAFVLPKIFTRNILAVTVEEILVWYAFQFWKYQDLSLEKIE